MAIHIPFLDLEIGRIASARSRHAPARLWAMLTPADDTAHLHAWYVTCKVWPNASTGRRNTQGAQESSYGTTDGRH